MARPYAIRRARLVPDLADPNLYGAWGMKPQGGLLVDHTPQGNDGVPVIGSSVENTILGPMRRYFDSINSGSAIGAANAFALGDLTASFWFRSYSDIFRFSLGYYQNLNDNWGITLSANIYIYDDIDNAGTTRYATPYENQRLHHCVAVMDSLENLLYLDGVLIGSGEFSSDNWASYAGTLYHGGRSPVNGIDALLSPLLIFNAAKDQDWVAQDYLKGARACQFKTDWGVRVSVGNETANARVGANSSPFEIISGTWQMSMDTIEGRPVKVIECAGAGRVAVPTSYFEATPTEAAFGTWEWWLYKGTTATNPRVMFVAATTDLVGAAAQLGYYFQVDAAETPAIREMTGGGTGAVATGTAGGFPIATWTKCRITRRYDGQLTYYQDDVQDAQATDLTQTIGNYVVLDLDIGDRFAYSDRKGDHAFVKLLGCCPP